ncbi:MAG: formate hydrogenlyase subunit 3/multisubunit Na+/H+ antiporter, MnhD subunit [Mycobacterium sp.]|nr:formate hydrogenlyase subunit 3/multisubunit Na+/H+ antiporter, MnhD subunit [Mycobacterium sp.]
MNGQVLAPLPVLIPTLAAATTLFAGRRPRLQRTIAVLALAAVVAVCAALLYVADRDGTVAVQVGGWGPGASGATGGGQSVSGMGPLGITLVVDRLSAMMLLVSAIVLLAVVFYAIGQGIRDGDEQQPVSIFLPTYLVLSAGVCMAFLAGDLFNLFVGFEVLLAASFVLLTIGASTERVRAGIAYVMVSMVSSLIFLIGIALIYAATGTLNMAELSVRLDGVPAGTRTALFAVLIVAFGIKAAVFPLSAWLPDSYPTAPAPVTAVFAGLLTKVGVYAIIRAHSLLFPSGGLDPLLLVAALLLGERVLPAAPAGWAACVALGLMHVAGQGSIAWAMGRLPTSTASVVVLVQPVVAGYAGWILFGEALGPLQTAGAAVALSGVVLAQWASRGPPAKAAVSPA